MPLLTTLLRDVTARLPAPARTLARMAVPRRAATLPKDTDRLLQVDMITDTEEDRLRSKLRSKGLFLTRQDRTQELAELIRHHDANRSSTPAGAAFAALIAEGARADITEAAHDLARDGALRRDGPFADGLESLEESLTELPRDYAIALVVAGAHMDVGWAWRGTCAEDDVPTENLHAFHHHFARASNILDRFSGVELDAPALAAARCGLLAAQPDAKYRVADDYEDLIDLDPQTPAHMRALGTRLLPAWFGSYGELEVQARRTVLRTSDLWGNGGYAWVYFDALIEDPGAVRQLDAKLLVRGMHDIVARRPNQHTVNRLAAFGALVCGATGELALYDPDLEAARDLLRAAAARIVRTHMTEVHPMVWAEISEALGGTGRRVDPRKRANHGSLKALHALAEVFRKELEDGQAVTLARAAAV